jgi:hypothetical protein
MRISLKQQMTSVKLIFTDAPEEPESFEEICFKILRKNVSGDGEGRERVSFVRKVEDCVEDVREREMLVIEKMWAGDTRLCTNPARLISPPRTSTRLQTLEAA